VVSVYKKIHISRRTVADPGVRAVCGRLIAGIKGSNPPERQGYSFLVFVVFCVGTVSAKSWSLVQRSPTVCVCVCVCVCLCVCVRVCVLSIELNN
jgi:hypothetical protein